MREYVCLDKLGADIEDGISKLVIKNGPALTCGALQLLVDVKACAVNYPDLMQTAGAHQHTTTTPFVPGMEFAGVISAVGEDVNDFKVGDRVMCGRGDNATGGGMSSQAVVWAVTCHLMPSHLSFAEASGFIVGYTTGYHCLVERGALKKGEWVLVHGATGGMGLAAVQMAKIIGAKVIATGGDDQKLEIVKAQGADHVINYNTNPNFRAAVKEFTDGKGADVVYDPVGGAVFDESMRCVNWGARLLIVGFTRYSALFLLSRVCSLFRKFAPLSCALVLHYPHASGVRPSAPMNLTLIKGLTIMGCRAGEFIRRHPDGATNIAAPRMKQVEERRVMREERERGEGRERKREEEIGREREWREREKGAHVAGERRGGERARDKRWGRKVDEGE
jgi:NADPH2:quinone reductase